MTIEIKFDFDVLTICSGTVEDTEMVDGLVLEQKISHLAGGVSSIEKAKIGLIQFCLSAPKTDVCLCKYISNFMYAMQTNFQKFLFGVPTFIIYPKSRDVCMHVYLFFSFLFYCKMDNQVIVSDYTQMDRVLREERQYILDLCKKIKKAGCNVLLIQKSILRFAPFCTLFPPSQKYLLNRIKIVFNEILLFCCIGML